MKKKLKGNGYLTQIYILLNVKEKKRLTIRKKEFFLISLNII